MSGTIGGSRLGLDPDYASLLAGRQNPRLLMAQKLMDLGTPPTTNSTQSSFWANLLSQGLRGGLAGHLYGQETQREKDEAAAQGKEAAAFQKRMQDLLNSPSPKGDGGAAPAAPAPAPAQGGGPRASLGAGALPPDQQQAIVTAATQGTMVPPHVLHALITQESGWRPGAQGKGSDTGLGQVTDTTAANPGYGLPPLSPEDRLDPNKNAAWSARYLEARGKAAGLTRPEDWNDPAKLALALKAYNGGGDPNYVANVTRRMQGRQADASPAPGSNIDALMAGVDQAKPRGVQLADASPAPGSGLSPNVDALFDAIDQAKSRPRVPRGVQLAAMLGNGNTATDSPTPILPDMGDAQGTAVPRVPVSASNLPVSLGSPTPVPPLPPSDAVGVPGPGLVPPAPPDAAALPLPSPADAAPPPAAAIPSPPPDLMPGAGPAPAIVPAPDAASVPTPDLANAAPTPAVVPPPDAAAAGAPPAPALVPDNPLGRADPASLAAFNGAPPAPTPAVVPPPDAAAVPQPTPAVVPPPAAATLPPLQGPPVPPGLLARRLVQPNDNASDALNTASLAAARAGQNFDPTAPGAVSRDAAGPTGAQLAAPLWAGGLTAAGAPLLMPADATGGPTGTQLAGPLVTPAAGPGDAGAPATGAPAPVSDPSAAGGPNKGAAGPASQSQPSASDRLDRTGTAGLQDRADQLAALAREAAGHPNQRIRAYAPVLEAQAAALQRRVDHFDTLDQQQQARRDAQSDRADERAFNRSENAATRAEAARTAVANRPPVTKEVTGDDGKVHMEQWDYDSRTWKDTGLLGPKQPGAAGPFPGNALQAADSNNVLSLQDKIANGTAKPEEQRLYTMSYNRLRDGGMGKAPDPSDPTKMVDVKIPGQDMSAYARPPLGPYAAGAAGQGTGQGGQDPNAARPIPGTEKTNPLPNESVGTAMQKNAQNLRLANATLDALIKNPNAIGPIKGRLPLAILNSTDPEGAPVRSMIANLSSLEMQDRSGKAVTANEMPQLKQFIPQIDDPPAVAIQKLKQFQQNWHALLSAEYDVHGPEGHFPKNGPVESALGAANPMPTDKGQLQNGVYYGLPNGQTGKWNAQTQKFVVH